MASFPHSPQAVSPTQGAPARVFISHSGLIHCCPTRSSVAAQADLLHTVAMGCNEMACSSIGLSWTVGKLLLCAWNSYPLALPLVPPGLLSYPSTSNPAAVPLRYFTSLYLLYQRTPSVTHSSALTVVGPCCSSWSSDLTWGRAGLF